MVIDLKDTFKLMMEMEATSGEDSHTKGLWKYVPKRLSDAVVDITHDSDGYWIYLDEDWHMGGHESFHCETVKDLRELLKRVRRR